MQAFVLQFFCAHFICNLANTVMEWNRYQTLGIRTCVGVYFLCGGLPWSSKDVAGWECSESSSSAHLHLCNMEMHLKSFPRLQRLSFSREWMLHDMFKWDLAVSCLHRWNYFTSCRSPFLEQLPCRLASWLLCRGVPGRRRLKTDICLTRCSGGNLLLTPFHIPHSPLSLGHLVPHHLFLVVANVHPSLCVLGRKRVFSGWKEKGAPYNGLV